MRVASIGPITRDFKIPDGRTVPKEPEAHIGRMCDTYGLFAIPGFDKKVCPTSGALINQIFWAVCSEIVEQIIRRTGGNVPRIGLSAAFKAGRRNQYDYMRMQYKERGY